MKLETAQSFSSQNASAADIHYAVTSDAQRGEFLILSKSKTCFVQAAGDTEPCFVVIATVRTNANLNCLQCT